MKNSYFLFAITVLVNNDNAPTAESPHFCLGLLCTRIGTYR